MSTSTKLQAVIPVIYLLITILLFAANLNMEQIKINHFVGISLSIPAFTLWIIARFQLGNAFSLKPKVKFLVTTGLYSKFKHPIYYLSTLSLLGIAIFFNNPLIFSILFIFVTIQFLRARAEEKILKEKFGEEYKQYANKAWF